MKLNTNKIKVTFGKVDQRHVQLGLVVLTLVLFVLGAGAPSSGGH